MNESKEDITGFISKPVARPEYGMITQRYVITKSSLQVLIYSYQIT